MAKFGKEFLIRTLSGIMIFVVFVGAVLISEFGFWALMLTICLGAMWEFYRMSGKKGVRIKPFYPMAVGAVAVTASFFAARGSFSMGYLTLLIPLVFLMFVIELYDHNPQPYAGMSVKFTGLLYVAVPLSLFSFIAFHGGTYDPKFVLCYIFIVWINDIFAYLTGVLLGRHPLFKRVSPKKSWEGFIGGLLFAIAFGVLCGYIRDESLYWWGGLAMTVVVSGVLGDLIESMFKRSAEVKDAGAIIPGHGGFLDRFDALIFSLPFVLAYFVIFAG